jgi:hypothetical protein
MGNTLAEIRARLAQSEQNKAQYDNAIFPFWNAKNDSTSTVRFLPDGNTENPYFWVEKQQIKLPFNGIKGGDPKIITVGVPCVEMFGREAYPQGCPILSEVRVWYKDESLKEKANRYWKKPQYIMQGFVRDNAVVDDEAPENPIRRFSLNKQLFNLIKAGLMDVDMLNIPCDYENGTDFRIVKTTKGQYADYGTSSYSRRESPLTKNELAAIDTYGLNNLSDFLGKKPSKEELVIIREMFEASVDGEEYDPERWGSYFRPSGMKLTKDNSESSKNDSDDKSHTEPEVNTGVTSSQAATSPVEGKNAADILNMIKARGKKTA